MSGGARSRKRGRPRDVLARDPVDLGARHGAFRIDERVKHHLRFLSKAHENDRDLDDAVVYGREPSGLDVDDGERRLDDLLVREPHGILRNLLPCNTKLYLCACVAPTERLSSGLRVVAGDPC